MLKGVTTRRYGLPETEYFRSGEYGLSLDYGDFRRGKSARDVEKTILQRERDHAAGQKPPTSAASALTPAPNMGEGLSKSRPNNLLNLSQAPKGKKKKDRVAALDERLELTFEIQPGSLDDAMLGTGGGSGGWIRPSGDAESQTEVGGQEGMYSTSTRRAAGGGHLHQMPPPSDEATPGMGMGQPRSRVKVLPQSMMTTGWEGEGLQRNAMGSHRWDTGMRSIKIYSDFWIVSRQSYKNEALYIGTRAQDAKLPPLRRILLSKEAGSRLRLMYKVPEGKIREMSSTFKIDTVGAIAPVVIPKQALWFGIQVTPGPPPFLRTKVVNIFARFTVINKLDEEIYCRSSGDVNGRYALPKDEPVEFHPRPLHRTTKARRLAREIPKIQLCLLPKAELNALADHARRNSSSKLEICAEDILESRESSQGGEILSPFLQAWSEGIPIDGPCTRQFRLTAPTAPFQTEQPYHPKKVPNNTDESGHNNNTPNGHPNPSDAGVLTSPQQLAASPQQPSALSTPSPHLLNLPAAFNRSGAEDPRISSLNPSPATILSSLSASPPMGTGVVPLARDQPQRSHQRSESDRQALPPSVMFSEDQVPPSPPRPQRHSSMTLGGPYRESASLRLPLFGRGRRARGDSSTALGLHKVLEEDQNKKERQKKMEALFKLVEVEVRLVSEAALFICIREPQVPDYQFLNDVKDRGSGIDIFFYTTGQQFPERLPYRQRREFAWSSPAERQRQTLWLWMPATATEPQWRAKVKLGEPERPGDRVKLRNSISVCPIVKVDDAGNRVVLFTSDRKEWKRANRRAAVSGPTTVDLEDGTIGPSSVHLGGGDGPDGGENWRSSIEGGKRESTGGAVAAVGMPSQWGTLPVIEGPEEADSDATEENEFFTDLLGHSVKKYPLPSKRLIVPAERPSRRGGRRASGSRGRERRERRRRSADPKSVLKNLGPRKRRASLHRSSVGSAVSATPATLVDRGVNRGSFLSSPTEIGGESRDFIPNRGHRDTLSFRLNKGRKSMFNRFKNTATRVFTRKGRGRDLPGISSPSLPPGDLGSRVPPGTFDLGSVGSPLIWFGEADRGGLGGTGRPVEQHDPMMSASPESHPFFRDLCPHGFLLDLRAAGFGVSLIDARPQELIYVAATGAMVHVASQGPTRDVALTVSLHNFQIDDKTAGSHFNTLVAAESQEIAPKKGVLGEVDFLKRQGEDTGGKQGGGADGERRKAIADSLSSSAFSPEDRTSLEGLLSLLAPASPIFVCRMDFSPSSVRALEQKGALILHLCLIAPEPLTVKVDQDTLALLMNFAAKQVQRVGETLSFLQNENCTKVLKSEEDETHKAFEEMILPPCFEAAGRSPLTVYVHKLRIEKVQMTLSFKSRRGRASGTGVETKGAGGGPSGVGGVSNTQPDALATKLVDILMGQSVADLGDMSNLRINLGGLQRDHEYGNFGVLRSDVEAEYMDRLKTQLVKVVGSLDLFLFARLSGTLLDGIHALFSEPYEGLLRGPDAFVVGVGRGLSTFFTSLAVGLCDSTSRFCGSLHAGVELLGQNDAVLEKLVASSKRYSKATLEKPDSLIRGAAHGVVGGLQVFGAGLAGVVVRPLTAWREGRGAGRVIGESVWGLGGVVTGACGGVLVSMQGLTAGMRDSFQLASAQMPQARHVRGPRAFDASGHIRPFSPQFASALAAVQKAEKATGGTAFGGLALMFGFDSSSGGGGSGRNAFAFAFPVDLKTENPSYSAVRVLPQLQDRSRKEEVRAAPRQRRLSLWGGGGGRPSVVATAPQSAKNATPNSVQMPVGFPSGSHREEGREKDVGSVSFSRQDPQSRSFADSRQASVPPSRLRDNSPTSRDGESQQTVRVQWTGEGPQEVHGGAVSSSDGALQGLYSGSGESAGMVVGGVVGSRDGRGSGSSNAQSRPFEVAAVVASDRVVPFSRYGNGGPSLSQSQHPPAEPPKAESEWLLRFHSASSRQAFASPQPSKSTERHSKSRGADGGNVITSGASRHPTFVEMPNARSKKPQQPAQNLEPQTLSAIAKDPRIHRTPPRTVTLPVRECAVWLLCTRATFVLVRQGSIVWECRKDRVVSLRLYRLCEGGSGKTEMCEIELLVREDKKEKGETREHTGCCGRKGLTPEGNIQERQERVRAEEAPSPSSRHRQEAETPKQGHLSSVPVQHPGGHLGLPPGSFSSPPARQVRLGSGQVPDKSGFSFSFGAVSPFEGLREQKRSTEVGAFGLGLSEEGARDTDVRPPSTAVMPRDEDKGRGGEREAEEDEKKAKAKRSRVVGFHGEIWGPEGRKEKEEEKGRASDSSPSRSHPLFTRPLALVGDTEEQGDGEGEGEGEGRSLLRSSILSEDSGAAAGREDLLPVVLERPERTGEGGKEKNSRTIGEGEGGDEDSSEGSGDSDSRSSASSPSSSEESESSGEAEEQAGGGTDDSVEAGENRRVQAHVQSSAGAGGNSNAPPTIPSGFWGRNRLSQSGVRREQRNTQSDAGEYASRVKQRASRVTSSEGHLRSSVRSGAEVSVSGSPSPIRKRGRSAGPPARVSSDIVGKGIGRGGSTTQGQRQGGSAIGRAFRSLSVARPVTYSLGAVVPPPHQNVAEPLRVLAVPFACEQHAMALFEVLCSFVSCTAPTGTGKAQRGEVGLVAERRRTLENQGNEWCPCPLWTRRL
uniref:Vacuolar protein sorting-associated protein 13 VPS13 adaptor binding domain-containing protein n=1 Tax=Chromera velia CCMP2878 TaxID=1169474 RepID=A0A0G4F7P6_9ALVE|eukprot:Cvel_2890.t1-p1 / transcript=Cvel_2890.t1 / gene=Cvel_2890 / organism=Chromera_velia_CCMP2878 / gene_product=Putative vacuolar protein sorting-associated, putative / transcript_product=Putative vacuolar protein sorting-associated, putative / location=Cvel_scaffold114:46166-58131(+) / protein_length=2651 / sequence_SO=supercontig / SO=protein_coding / is_pseudo=false